MRLLLLLAVCVLSGECGWDGYESIRSTFLEAENADAQELRHQRTGARIAIFLPRHETKERTFGIGFRTPVTDNTGAPHILEHAVLSGSQKYPVKFPLQHFISGSVTTNINAETHIDRTLYWGTTIDDEDLINIASVFLDAVFNPLLLQNENAFNREGWRLEMSNASSNLFFSGTVYNEMKGAFSSPMRFAELQRRSRIHSGTNYGFESGGLPEAILSLSYGQLKSFYRKHYHPSNAMVSYFGSAGNLEDLLLLLDSELNSAADRYGNDVPDPISILPPVYAYKGPRLLDFPYTPADPLNPTNYLDITFYLEQSKPSMCDSYEMFLLSSLLASSRTSPLRKKLENAEFGTRVLPGVISTTGFLPSFRIGVSGIDAKTASDDIKEKFEKTVLGELERIQVEGFDEVSVRAVINGFSFTIRGNVASNRANEGLELMQEMFQGWTQGTDPWEDLKALEALDCLQLRLRNNPKRPQELISKYFLDHERRVVSQFVADVELAKRRDAAEREKLVAMRELMTAEELELVTLRTHEIQEYNSAVDSPAELATMPVLSLDNASRMEKIIHSHTTSFGKGIPIIDHILPTAGIAFIFVCFDLKDLDMEELRLLNFLTELLPLADAPGRSAKQLHDILLAETNALETYLKFGTRQKAGYIGHRDQASAQLYLSWQCLNENMKRCVDVVADMLFHNNFEINKDTAVHMVRSTIEKGIQATQNDPFSFISKKVKAPWSAKSLLMEKLMGAPAIVWNRSLLNEIETNWTGVVQKLNSTLAKILHPSNVAVNIGADSDTLTKSIDAIGTNLLEPLSARAANRISAPSYSLKNGLIYHVPAWFSDLEFSETNRSQSEIYIHSGMVAHNFLSGPIYEPGARIPYNHVQVAKILSTRHMLRLVRFVGGAYGAHVGLDFSDGTYTFKSYRDPSVATTYEVMLSSVDALDKIAQEIGPQDIQMSILSAIADLDSPEGNSGKSEVSFMMWLKHVGLEDLQSRRDSIFRMSQQDIVDFAAALKAALFSYPRYAVTCGNPDISQLSLPETLPPFSPRTLLD